MQRLVLSINKIQDKYWKEHSLYVLACVLYVIKGHMYTFFLGSRGLGAAFLGAGFEAEALGEAVFLGSVVFAAGNSFLACPKSWVQMGFSAFNDAILV